VKISKLTPILLSVSMLSSATYAATTAASTPSVTPAQRAQIESVVHDYLVQKPEVIVEAIQVLQQRQMQQTKQVVQQTQQTASSFANALFHANGDPVVGNANGSITLVEFFDYQCPHCIEVDGIMTSLISSNPNLRVVFKDFPIRGPASVFAAKASLAANMQGKYMVLHHALMQATQPLTNDMILSLAKANGLDMTKLQKDINSSAVDNQIQANMKLAQDLKLFGTPAFFVGSTDLNKDKSAGSITYVPGAVDQKQLQDLINKVNS